MCKETDNNNNFYLRYSIHIDDQIINNVKECIENFKVIPMEERIPLSPALQPEYTGKIRDYISSYEQFMINFGKVTSDSYGIKMEIESKSLSSIQRGIEQNFFSNNQLNGSNITTEWYLCKFSNQISNEDKNQMLNSLKQLMNDTKKKSKLFKKYLKFIMIFISIMRKNLNMFINHLVISFL